MTDRVEAAARAAHEAYERLASDYDYLTRSETAVPWDELPGNNRALMLASIEAALAAADGVERPVAQRLADALKESNRYLGSALAYREAHEGLPLGTIVTESAAGQAWCVAAAVLAEWDATQEPAT